MLYFPSLIIVLCKRHGVTEKPNDEISNPQASFDKTVIMYLLKPKGKKI